MAVSTPDTSEASRYELPWRRQLRRLHHHAYPVRDQEVNRHFREDILGTPPRATWTESVHTGKCEEKLEDRAAPEDLEFCHTLFEQTDGGALAFFQIGAPYETSYLVGPTNLYDHLVSRPTPTPSTRSMSGCSARASPTTSRTTGTWVSRYVAAPDGPSLEFCADPPDVDEIRAQRPPP